MEQILTGRRVGNTTRIIDDAIQYLFEKGTISLYSSEKNALKSDIVDHGHIPGNMAQENFVYRFYRRVRLEHSLSVEYSFDANSKLHIFTVKKDEFD